MWPSHATLYLVPCIAQQEYDEKIAFWKDICGLDFSPLMCVVCVFDNHMLRMMSIVAL